MPKDYDWNAFVSYYENADELQKKKILEGLDPNQQRHFNSVLNARKKKEGEQESDKDASEPTHEGRAAELEDKPPNPVPSSTVEPHVTMSKKAGTSLDLSEIMSRAITDDEQAVQKLFAGFLTEDEKIIGCGYLGSLGVIFKNHSFWCITNLRACTLRIKVGGELGFSSGYLEYINSDAFYQPSLILLWVIIVLTVIFTWGLGLLLIPLIISNFYKVKKSGIVFWVREGIPVYIFADRHNLLNAQRVFLLLGRARNQRKREKNDIS